MNERTHLDLFSGIGGFAIAARWAGFRTVAFVEKDEFCQKIIAQNFGAVMADASRERCGETGPDSGRCSERSASGRNALIFGDIFGFDGRRYEGIDLLTGGFPCQPFSCAGKRKGKADDRHLWPEMLRVIKESKPRWIIGENVAGIITMELDGCISDLEAAGHTVQAFIIPACAADAKHRRDRVWIVAYSERGRRREQLRTDTGGPSILSPVGAEGALCLRSSGEALADSPPGRWGKGDAIGGRAQQGTGTPRQRRGLADSGDVAIWPTEPELGRVAHGIPRRVDRLKGLGNAIVPQVAQIILHAINQLEGH